MSVIIETVKTQAMFEAGMVHEGTSGGWMVVGTTRTEGGDPSPGRHVVFVNRNGTTEETA